MTTQIAKEETCCHHIGYSFQLAARVLLYAPSHRQDSTYHGLCYTSRGALAGMRNSSMGGIKKSPMGPLRGIDQMILRGQVRYSSVVECNRSLDQSLMVDPLSYFTFQPVHHDWINNGHGECYPVYGMVHKTKFPCC